MYRIELSPGEQAVFRTIEELATGIRNGVISPRARIYHNASEKWLPIEFHPHYKQALERLSSGKSLQEPVSPPAAPTAQPATPAPAVRAASPSPAPAPKPHPVPTRAPRDETVREIDLPSFALTEPKSPEPAPPAPKDRSLGQRPIRLAVVGAAAILSTHVMLSAAPPRIELPPEPAAGSMATASVMAPAAIVSLAGTRPRPSVRPVAASVRTTALAQPRAEPHDSTISIEPPPATLDLRLPALPRADSIAPESSARDSAAMKRILRAVGGNRQ